MRRFVLISVVLLLAAFSASAQGIFKQNQTMTGVPGENASSSEYKEDENENEADTLQGFSFKHLTRGLHHKEPLRPGYAMLGSAIMPGRIQIYNKDYWKLPVVYAGIGAGIGGGLYFNDQYHKTGDKKYATYRTLCYAGAALVYWGQILDGVACLPDSRTPDPGKAAVFSALLPGLGQAYVGDWWHIPIWYGGLAVCGYTLHLNQIQYKRYKYIYMLATDKDSGYAGRINETQATTYKDLYHRYRDYSVVATILVYALNIIDANVFAYMKDFNVSDDLSFNVEPALIDNLDSYYMQTPAMPSFGLNMTFNF
ncbi:MAG: hypothetical protein IKX71_02130 [Bacteroidales bacterium]|nr:hypothetical protein [Bacteroidales bacterium]